jgi:hypothetical protein
MYSFGVASVMTWGNRNFIITTVTASGHPLFAQ